MDMDVNHSHKLIIFFLFSQKVAFYISFDLHEISKPIS